MVSAASAIRCDATDEKAMQCPHAATYSRESFPQKVPSNCGD